MSIIILCAIDDQCQSEHAVEAAIDLAKETAASLIFYMVNPAVLPGPRGPEVYLWDASFIKSYLDEASRRARMAGLLDVKCTTDRARVVSEAIVRRAKQHYADFIVVGAERRSRIAEFLHGSVPQEIVKQANCPVLIVQQRRNATAPN